MDRRTFNRGLLGTVGVAALPPLFGQEDNNRLLIDEGFEGEIPDFHTYQASYAADAARAHGGQRSLRVTVAPGKASGGAYFRLDGLVKPGQDYEFSAWVWCGSAASVRLYVSAHDGKSRYIRGQAAGGKPGEWMQLTGTVRGREGHADDHETMLAMSTTGESWFDDVVLRETVLPTPPIEAYPLVAHSLHGLADRRATALRPGETYRLDGRQGALTPGFQPGEAVRPDQAAVPLPPDGMLVFAVDAPVAMWASGVLVLEPSSDLRPGLRATVLCDTTVIGAPMVAADPWQGVGNALTGPAPECVGTRPPDRIGLTPWLLPAGRHHLCVASPHCRAGGTFRELELTTLGTPVRPPLQQFALLSDTHLGSGRPIWMNAKLDGPACAELGTTLAALRAEGIDYAFLAGDMTDGGTREQFALLAQACAGTDLPVYGCIGNHDSYHASSRSDALELCAKLFPTGSTDYAVRLGRLRFVVLDGSHWKAKDGRFVDRYDAADSGGIGVKPEQIQWLQDTLAADRHAPTIFVWHFPLHNRQGISSCGYRLGDWHMGPEVLATLEQAPNVVATLCGHTHWNEANVRAGRPHLVNPAFCEWPNAYRVFRVYEDHLEWELRQVANRGFVRESCVVPKALSWMISTAPGDLGGRIDG